MLYAIVNSETFARLNFCSFEEGHENFKALINFTGLNLLNYLSENYTIM